MTTSTRLETTITHCWLHNGSGGRSGNATFQWKTLPPAAVVNMAASPTVPPASQQGKAPLSGQCDLTNAPINLSAVRETSKKEMADILTVRDIIEHSFVIEV